MIRLLFVCMGNICRSPTAEGVFAKIVRREGLDSAIHVDSAGTHAYHLGDPPDRRARAAAQARGVELGHLRARRLETADFERSSLIVAMDEENHRFLLEECPDAAHRSKIRLFMEFAPDAGNTVVPDPYYGGRQGFERVLDLVEHASEGLLQELRRSHGV